MEQTGTALDVRKVVSASRRVDLVACYPDLLVEKLRTAFPPEGTHSVVLWTKDPRPLLESSPLNETLSAYELLYVHLTVTGMGGGILEPRVPAPEEVLALLPRLVELVGGPEMVRVRFDPIVHFKMPDGSEYSNFDFFPIVLEAAARSGVRSISISWVQLYRKVRRRLASRGILPVELSLAEKRRELDLMEEKAHPKGVTLLCCAVPGFPRSSCVDGSLLMRLHPRGLACSTKRARGQRADCGCTESVDIGWYVNCPNGCLYCYANPGGN